MLRTAKDVIGTALGAQDGEIGKIKDFYFDDHFWTVRYLVADTGNWLTGRMVLLSPHAIGPTSEAGPIAVNLNKKQIEESPSWESDKPVSRQFEQSYYGYYGWPMYWGGSNMWGFYPYIMRGPVASAGANVEKAHWDSHLRSTNEVAGYHIHGLNGEIGHVHDFIFDDENWAIRYLVIDTRNWLPGKLTLISPHWVDRVSWEDSRVFVNVTTESLKFSPIYAGLSGITPGFEAALQKYYENYFHSEATVESTKV